MSMSAVVTLVERQTDRQNPLIVQLVNFSEEYRDFICKDKELLLLICLFISGV